MINVLNSVIYFLISHKTNKFPFVSGIFLNHLSVGLQPVIFSVTGYRLGISNTYLPCGTSLLL